MGRGRPRGNKTQRAIGRAVGRGLRGVEPPKLGCWTLFQITFFLLVLGIAGGELWFMVKVALGVVGLFGIIFLIRYMTNKV